MVDPVTDTASATAALTVALDIIADLIALRDYFFSTMEPEVRKTYEYSYDIRQNLIRLMDAIEGAYYKAEKPDKVLKTPYQQDMENINKKIKELKKYIEESETYSRTGMAVWQYTQAKIEVTNQVRNFFRDIWDFIKKIFKTTIDSYEKHPYPLTIPSAKKEDGQKTEETDLAAADTG